MSLRAILGGSSRVRKSKGSGSAKRSSPASSRLSAPTRRKSSTARAKQPAGGEDAEDFFDDKLDDVGLVTALAINLNLRDTAQAIYYIRAHMFSPMPQEAAGMNSTRIAEVLNYRKRLPPIVTVSHIQTLLSSPSAVEREIAELARSGFLRRTVVAKRGDIGETLILAADFEQMVRVSPSLAENTKDAFVAYMKGNTGMQTVGGESLSKIQTSQLIQAGFLTAHHTGITSYASMSSTMNLYSRPEDKGTLTSLETVSRQPAGSLGTVGGEGAVHNAGGSGGRTRSTSAAASAAHSSGAATELKLAVPGNGTFLTLLSAALEHLVWLLGRSRFREVPESVLRDRWVGGVVGGEARHAGKHSRGEFAGVLPGQTRKWRQFYGLSFDWVLREAVGSGLVEVFETGSVGRGVRVC
ncbi:hypothetical protein DL764_003358 [Monosporascus ibericus]|uniref:Serine-threonine protein kinase 19 n=1 Tax=Monosporascus ibericus TaxID=155417 RepID=A0A4Q4THG8_9PEZI|nr:hypothetical protein DL764_003358 [Monosporascus ibericus]